MTQARHPRRGTRPQFHIEELEPRLLFSADPMLAVMAGAPGLVIQPDPLDAPALSLAALRSADTFQSSAQPTPTPTASASDSRPREIAFVDLSVEGAQDLIEALQSQQAQGRDIEVVTIAVGDDGLDVITQTLALHQGVDAVHVFSHGDAQGLQVGTARLDADALNARLGDIAGWANAFAQDGDLLLYGCNLAGSAEGRSLVDGLSLLTGSDVAASDDLTGSAARGGDWTLEYQTGRVEASTAMTAALLGDWRHTLATVTIQQGVNGYTGTVDTFLDMLSPLSNNANSTSLEAGRTLIQSENQTLLRFENIVGAGGTQIPQGAIVTAVTVSLYVTDSGSAWGGDLSMYRMQQTWAETATWSSMGSGVDFTERALSADATMSASGSTGAYRTFASTSALVSTVQGWLDDPSSNHGWVITSANNSSNTTFQSSETGNGPRLVVTYFIPAPPALDLDANNSSGAPGTAYQGGFTEGGSPVRIADTDATLTAGSSSTITRMTVTLNNRPNGTSEVLAATVTGSITASYNTGTGVLTLTGSGTMAQYQQVLRSVTYNNTSLNPDTGERTLTVVVTDAYKTTATATSTLAITAVNNAPTVSTTGSALAYTENAGAVVIDGGITLSDVDSPQLTGATVQLSTNYVNGQDLLGFTSQNGIVGSWNAATGTLTLSGTATVAQYQAALRSVTYSNSSDAPSTSTRTARFSVSDGNLSSTAATRSITVAAVNDAPVATIAPATYSATEQTNLALQGTGLSISDLDAGTSAVRTTLSVTSGVLTVQAGTSGATVSGSGTTSVTLNGTLAQINALLAGTGGATITYLHSSNTPPASATLTLTVNDQGNTGSGGARTGSDTAAINIAAVNDAPTATIAPTTYSATEQTNLTLHGTGLSIADPDAGSSAVQATLSVTAGILTVAAGTTGVTVSGSGTGSVILTGTLTQINNLLTGLNSGTITYRINSDTPPASATFTLAVSDLGNTGSGGALTASDTATINIAAVNDAPTATITPASYNTTEQVSLSLHGTGLSIADLDAGSSTVQATLSVTAGVLTVAAGTTGVTVAGSGSTSVTLTGTLAQINSLLSGLNGGTVSYVMNSNTPPASATLTLAVNDQGNTGSGGARTGSDTAVINIAAVNDAPTATIAPTTYSATEQTNLTLHGTGLSIADVDAGSSAVQATLSVTAGILTVAAGTTGVTVSGSGTGSVTLTGTLTQINNLLAGLNSGTITYRINSDTPPASATFTLAVSDLGNTGSGGALTASDTATINIAAVNDAPTATITPTTYNATEQISLSLHGTGLSIADVDAGASTVRATLSVTTGMLTVAAGSTGVTVAGSGSTAVTLTGTVAQINMLLAGNGGATVTFVHASDIPPASTVLTLSVNDQGNTGSGGARTGSDTATINIAAVNDPPSVLVNLGATLPQGQQVVLSNLRLRATDPDHSAAQLVYTITANPAHGVLTRNGVTLGVGGTFTQADLDNGLVAYTHDNSMTPADQFEFSVSDPLGGSTGNTVFAITVYDLNTAPTLSTNLPATVLEGQSTVITALQLSAQDAEEAAEELVYTLTASPLHGQLMLNGTALASSDTFTQQDINDGLLSYQHDDSESASDGFSFTLSDGRGGTVGNTDFVLNVTLTDDAPTAVVGEGTVLEGGNLLIDSSLLQVDDTDSPAGAVFMTLQAVPAHGVLTLRGTALGVGDVFTQADIDAGDLLYQHNGGEDTADQFVFSVTDGSTSTAPLTLKLGITPQNDAPQVVIAAPSYNVQEQQVLNLHGTGLSVNDLDAGTADVQVTLSVLSGSLSVITGGTGVDVVGSGTGTLVLTGTVAQINQLLAGLNGATLQYLVDSDTPPASDVLTVMINDLGNTGNGGSLSASQAVLIDLTAVNDAPVATIVVPGYSASEQTPLALQGTGLSVSDADAGGSTVQVTLSVVHGVLMANAAATGTVVTGSGTASLTFTGTLAQISALLAGSGGATLSYLIDADSPPDTDTLSLAINDQGHTGAGGPLSGSATATITINAINDAPSVSITAPSYTATEQVALALHGTGLAVSDPDSGSALVTATVSVASGQLLVSAGGTGVVVSGGGSSSVTLTGSLAQINALLAGVNGATLIYLAPSDTPATNDTLSLTLNDLGNEGLGGALIANDSVLIAITAVNDAPVATAPPAYTAVEQTPLALQGSTGLSLSDVDAGNSSVQATLSVIFGTLIVNPGSTGVVVSGSGTSSLTLTGTVAQINTLLAGNGGATLSYVVTSDTPPDTDTLTLAIDDLGNTGSGGALTDSASATISITALNDAPTVSITTPSYTATEQLPLVLHGTGLSLGDVDADSAPVRATLSVVTGTLLVGPGSTGATVSGSGSNTVVLTGTLAQINALLAGSGTASVRYLISSEAPPANDTLTLTVDDLGNEGLGGALIASDSVLIAITAVNDAPVVTAPPAYTAMEQAPLALQGTGLSLSDVDAGNSSVQATLSVVFGTLTVNPGSTGVAVSGSGSDSLTLTGTIAQINALLAGSDGATLSYVIHSDTPPETDTLTLTIDDLGSTGAGGPLSDTATAIITVTAVNDTPTVSITAPSYAATEQVPLALHGTGLSVADLDAGTKLVQLVMSVSSGTLSAQAGNTGVVIGGSGGTVVVLTATLAQINALLAGDGGASLSYLIDSDTPPATDHLTLAVHDLGGTGAGGARVGEQGIDITITAVHDAPRASDDRFTTSLNTALPLSPGLLMGNDVSPERLGMVVSIVEAPLHGTLLIAADGSVVYQPAAGYVGADRFRYVLNDGVADSNVATVHLTVQGTASGPAVPGDAHPTPGEWNGGPPPPTLDPGPGQDAGTDPPGEPAGGDQGSDGPGRGPDELPEEEELLLAPGAGPDDRPSRGRSRLLSYGLSSSYDIPESGYRMPVTLIEVPLTTARQDSMLTTVQLTLADNAHLLASHLSLYQDDATSDELPLVKLTSAELQTVGSMLSIGAVWWAARGATLLASLLVTTPIWRNMDPLPVLFQRPHDRPSDGGAEDGDAERMFEEPPPADLTQAEIG